MEIKPQNDYLHNLGWYFSHYCQCGGAKKENWHHAQKPGYEIKIAVSNDFFQVMLFDREVMRGRKADLSKSVEMIP